MKKTILFFAIALFQITAFAQQENENVVNAYIKVKDALVKSDNKAATAASAELLTAVSALKGQEELKKATAHFSEQSDLEKQRAAFATVSTSVWGLVKDSKELNQSLYYQYCPMKKSYWVSTEEKIKNPYYGAQMLTCGKVAEKKLK